MGYGSMGMVASGEGVPQRRRGLPTAAVTFADDSHV